MKNYRTQGIVIKRRDAGEADRLLTVFTPTFGKIFVKAPGVRKITSRRSSHIEPFTYSMFTLYKGKTTSIATEVQTIQNFSLLRTELSKIGQAYHLCELIDGLCPEAQEHPDVFTLLVTTLTRLEKEENTAPIIREFENTLLELLGFASQKTDQDSITFIEQLLERKLRTRRLLYNFT